MQVHEQPVCQAARRTEVDCARDGTGWRPPPGIQPTKTWRDRLIGPSPLLLLLLLFPSVTSQIVDALDVFRYALTVAKFVEVARDPRERNAEWQETPSRNNLKPCQFLCPTGWRSRRFHLATRPVFLGTTVQGFPPPPPRRFSRFLSFNWKRGTGTKGRLLQGFAIPFWFLFSEKFDCW